MMGSGAQPAAAWQDAESVDEAETSRAADGVVASPPPEARTPLPEAPGSPLRRHIPALALALLAALWVALALWTAIGSLSSSRNPVGTIAEWIALGSAPLALIGIFYILLGRTSRREARRFVKVARAMRMEAAQLEQMLATMSARIDANRTALGEQAHQLLLLGDDAGARLAEIGAAMTAQTEALSAQTGKLEAASSDARTDLGVLLADLPKAEAHVRDIGSQLREAGLAAHGQAAALQAELSALTAKGCETDELLGATAQRLNAHLAQIESGSAAAARQLSGTADEARAALDAVLAQAAETLDSAHKGIAAQNAALIAMIEEARAALEGAGSDAAGALAQRLDTIGTRLEGFGKLLGAQEIGTGALLAGVEQKLGGLSQDLDRIADAGGRRLGEMRAGIVALEEDAAKLGTTLEQAQDRAGELAARADALRSSLGESSSTLADSLPRALNALEEQATRSREAISAASVHAVKLVTSATATTARLGEAEAMLQRHQEALEALGASAAGQLDALEQQAAALEAALRRAGEGAERLGEQAGPQLIETLLRVREAAAQAAQKAREAIADAIPEATRALGQAAGPAAAEALHAQVETQLALVSAASERAVQAAHQATERLMRQMLTIADTTSAVEARITEAKAELEEQDQDASARRVALLIESLNSIAIDVTKILSNDVTDSAWAAYLKGDRGIFTRRAVRLLDQTEAREIVRHYEEEPEFRQQVNRYVHDFEAMLRRVLAARDGSPLGVALLSSDMGKLYVALAQAIERLRT